MLKELSRAIKRIMITFDFQGKRAVGKDDQECSHNQRHKIIQEFLELCLQSLSVMIGSQSSLVSNFTFISDHHCIQLSNEIHSGI